MMMPETYIFRLERPAQIVNNRSVPRKYITFRLDSRDPGELARSFGEFLLSCGYSPSVVRGAMRAAGGGGETLTNDLMHELSRGRVQHDAS
jgi:hypothetical protein